MTYTPVFSGLEVAFMKIHDQTLSGFSHFLNANGTWTGKQLWSSSGFPFYDCFGRSGKLNLSTTDGYNYTFEDNFYL